MKDQKWIALAALPVAIAILYGLDLGIDKIREVTSLDLRFRLYIAASLAANLVYAAVVIGTSALAAQSRQRWVGVVYAITGGVLIVYPALWMMVPVLGRLPDSIVTRLPYSFTMLDPRRGWMMIGAFILAIGVWLSVRRNPVAEASDG